MVQITPHTPQTYHVGELTLERPTATHSWGISINPTDYPLAARWLRQAVQFQQWRTGLPLETVQAAQPLVMIDWPDRLFVELNAIDPHVVLAVAAALAQCCDIPLVYK
jgi:hypothetical protein